MPKSRKVIRGVLQNFLGTFTSRYSDVGGYWLFGLLAEEIDHLRIDLMGQGPGGTDQTPLAVARSLAGTKFAEQLAKADVPKSCLREAFLVITKSPDPRLGDVNGHVSSGHDVTFTARAVTDLGKAYESATSLFIAPHDPGVELRSTRAS